MYIVHCLLLFTILENGNDITNQSQCIKISINITHKTTYKITSQLLYLIIHQN